MDALLVYEHNLAQNLPKNTGQPVLLILNTGSPVLYGVTNSQYWKTSICIVGYCINNTSFPVLFAQQYWKTGIVNLQYWNSSICILDFWKIEQY